MGKGAETRERILDQAVRLASRDGLEGLTIGTLSSELGLSKSGLFAHFGSKDELQLQVLQAAITRFEDNVIRPALVAPRGEPRLRALFERWLIWIDDPSMPGGCPLITAAIEFDDKPGSQQELLIDAQRRRCAFMAKAVQMAIDAGHFRTDLDPEQITFELDALVQGYQYARRLLRDPRAGERVRKAFERLLADSRV